MSKLKFTIVVLMLICPLWTVAQEESIAQSDAIAMRWPDDYSPEQAKFFVHNEIEINARPETVWNVLIHAESWPLWYEGASEVKVVNSEDGVLRDGSLITWKTMGLRFESTIKEFEPFQRLSWESINKNIRGYHAWLIIPTSNGCKLITEESQHGWLTFLEKTFQPNKLHKLHDIWLQAIKEKAETRSKNVASIQY